MSMFQSTRPARGATRADAVTHASERVSIHAPRAGGDRDIRTGVAVSDLFQSTRPARGATACELTAHPVIVSIHAPRAGGDL